MNKVIIEVRKGIVTRIETDDADMQLEVIYKDDCDKIEKTKTFEWPFTQPNKYEDLLGAADDEDEEGEEDGED